jgi:uncharacterized coiled-coil DUF342 family protein
MPRKIPSRAERIKKLDDAMRKIHNSPDYNKQRFFLLLNNKKQLREAVSSNEEVEKILSAFKKLKTGSMSEGIQDIHGENVFYHPKSKTILLFDLSR